MSQASFLLVDKLLGVDIIRRNEGGVAMSLTPYQKRQLRIFRGEKSFRESSEVLSRRSRFEWIYRLLVWIKNLIRGR